MNEVIELSGLSRLLSTMNPVQLKHLRSYMEMFDQENKSAKLFSFLSEENKEENFEDISKRLGYSSKAAPAFRKLVQRFSTKVYDYLLTDHAIRFGNPNGHSREKNETIKKNLQAFMLLELNNPEKGLEILDGVLSNAMRHELFIEAKEALMLKKKLKKKLGLNHQTEKLELQINTLSAEKEKTQILVNNIMTFNYGACNDVQWVHNKADAKILVKTNISELQSSLIAVKIGQIRKLQIKEKYAEAYVQTIDLYHFIRKSVNIENSLTQHVRTLLLENSMIQQRHEELVQLIRFFEYLKRNPSVLTHRQYELVFYDSLYSRNHELSKIMLSKLVGAEYLNTNKALTFRINYYQCLYSFVYEDPRIFIDLVSTHFKKLGGPESIIALYLRSLELISFYQKEKFELLEYKIRNLVKSISRFNQKNSCTHLKEISQLFSLLLRKNYLLTEDKFAQIQQSYPWLTEDLSLQKVHNPVTHFISSWVIHNCRKSKKGPTISNRL